MEVVNVPTDRFAGVSLVALLVAMAACAPAPPGAAPATTVDGAPHATGSKRITVAISSIDPPMLRYSAGGFYAGLDHLEDLVHAGLTRRDNTDTLRPFLAEALPSTENGFWKVFPDGQMETTWTLKQGIHWQDGTPFTTQDLLFTLAVCTDDDMILFSRHLGREFVGTARALDDRTITVAWKRPYIDADALFTIEYGMPMPRHLLEAAYRQNKEGFADLPYWNREFVGAGPYQVREWVDGSHIKLRAFDGYILGRPKVDEIVVKFIPDPNTVVANVLAGEIDVHLGRGVTLEQGLEIRDHWREGRMEVDVGGWQVLVPQFIDPRPAVLLEARFRKALVQAIDRQELTDTLQSGLAPVAHAYIDTSQPRYRELDPFVIKYAFDPRSAVQLIESTGHVRGSDGVFRDRSGQRLSVEVRITGTQDIQGKAQLAVADYWQQVGIAVEPLVMGAARTRDFEYRATRPAFELGGIPDGLKGLRRSHGSETPLPENDFRKRNNLSRYTSSAYDALLDRFFSTVPLNERMQVLGQILHHTTDQLTLIPLFYMAQPILMSKRLVGMGPTQAAEGTSAWNAHEWDMR